MEILKRIIILLVCTVIQLHASHCNAQSKQKQLKAEIGQCLDSFMQYTNCCDTSLRFHSVYILTFFEISDTCTRFSIFEVSNSFTFNRDGIFAKKYFTYNNTYILVYFTEKVRDKSILKSLQARNLKEQDVYIIGNKLSPLGGDSNVRLVYKKCRSNKIIEIRKRHL